MRAIRLSPYCSDPGSTPAHGPLSHTFLSVSLYHQASFFFNKPCQWRDPAGGCSPPLIPVSGPPSPGAGGDPGRGPSGGPVLPLWARRRQGPTAAGRPGPQRGTPFLPPFLPSPYLSYLLTCPHLTCLISFTCPHLTCLTSLPALTLPVLPPLPALTLPVLS